MSGNYGTVLSTELREGSYCCVRTKGPFGLLIRTFTRSLVDHAFINLGHGMIAEATPWGVQVNSIDRYHGQPMFTDAGDVLTTQQRLEVCDKARSFTGREYGWGAILLITLRLMGGRSPRVTRLLSDQDAVICSQLVAECGAAVGVDSWLCGRENAEFVEPADLLLRRGMERVRWV